MVSGEEERGKDRGGRKRGQGRKKEERTGKEKEERTGEGERDERGERKRG